KKHKLLHGIKRGSSYQDFGSIAFFFIDEDMVKQSFKNNKTRMEKSKAMRKEMKKKKVREMSNSCQVPSSEQRLQEQVRETLLRNVETLNSELERLQLLNERMNGEGINGLSFAELRSLETQLNQGLLSVNDQLAKKTLKLEEDERLLMQAGEGEDVWRERICQNRSVNITHQLALSKQRRLWRNLARKFRISCQGIRKHDHNHDEALLHNIKSMKREIERIRLLNERMSGRELDGLCYFQLMILQREINYGLVNVKGREVRKKLEEHAKRFEDGSSISQAELLERVWGQKLLIDEHDQSSLDNGTNDHQSDISSRFRL
ncbi:unnamed protein product, partial [Arabidopsis halleri]